jgi:hypothetical protein
MVQSAEVDFRRDKTKEISLRLGAHQLDLVPEAGKGAAERDRLALEASEPEVGNAELDPEATGTVRPPVVG